MLWVTWDIGKRYSRPTSASALVGPSQSTNLGATDWHSLPKVISSASTSSSTNLARLN